MKKHYLLIAAAGVLAAIPAQAGSMVDEGVGLDPSSSGGLTNLNSGLPQLSKGTQELGVGGSLDFNDGIAWDLSFSYGYFVMDNWEVGATLDWNGEDGDIFMDSRVGLFTEYNFATGTRFVPYVGVAATYAASGDRFNPVNGTTIGGEEGFAFSGELGVKYFFRPNMAIYGAVNFSWSPDDVFGVADEIKDNLTQIEIGMRFYF